MQLKQLNALKGGKEIPLSVISVQIHACAHPLLAAVQSIFTCILCHLWKVHKILHLGFFFCEQFIICIS